MATAQPMPPALYMYVADLEATYQRALGAGATSLQPPTIRLTAARPG